MNGRILPGSGAAFRLATGEAVTAESAGVVTLTEGSLYAGWDLEIYAPDAETVVLDGAELGVGGDDCTTCWMPEGPWVRVRLPAGDHTLSVE